MGVDELRDPTARPTEAAQALSTILQTQYLRYWIIASWALGLLAVVNPFAATLWFAATLAAGTIRGWFEKRVADRVGADYGLVFPAVATATTVFWAAAPLLAWTSPSSFGKALAVAYLACGYLLVFTQLRNSPKQALVISSPYSLVAAAIAIMSWGGPDFWPFISILPFLWSGLAVHVILSLLAQEKIRTFQTHQAHLIAELEAARDRADAANKAKSAFLAVISHELRTPMNGVLGAAQLLGATRLDRQQTEFVSIVKNSGDSLLALLNDILDLTKIEADRMAFEAIDVDLRELVERVGATWRCRAVEKDIGYSVEVDPSVPGLIVGDPTRLSQILHNLVSNAVKFTDAGSVRLVVRADKTSVDRARLSVSVIDTGPGIASEDYERLFQPFTQLDASSTRKFGGTGLGLTISRKLAEMMGGELSVRSKIGRGSTFTFKVELEVRSWATTTVRDTDLEAGECADALRVLIVEDHPVNRLLVEAWLTSAGHAAASAEHGEAALALCDIQPFDVVLMDVNMPVMDGLTATRRLRQTVGPNRTTPVVILSASARTEDHDAGFAAGADAYLNKPIDFSALAALLEKVPHGREALRSVA